MSSSLVETSTARMDLCLSNNHEGLLSLPSSQSNRLIQSESIHDKYIVEHTPFARGKFAAVRKCVHRESGIAYAAKFIRKRRRAMDVRHEIHHEMAVLDAALGHARIVTMHEVYETASEMVLVLELASGGELQRVIDEDEVVAEKDARRLLRQILEGLIFLHDRSIAHLDLKPQNLLLTAAFPRCDVKLCDFGISRVIQDGVEVREILGTPDYLAPEVLQYEPISLSTDMWSVGVLVYVLLSGHSPFAGDTKQETFCNISQGVVDFPEDIFRGVSQEARHFISSLLVIEPSDRLSARQCLEHRWLAQGKEKCVDSFSQTPKLSPFILRRSDKDNLNNIDKRPKRIDFKSSTVGLILDKSVLC